MSTYRAIAKVGTRKRQWLIVNEHGGLIEEFDGTENAAEIQAAKLAKEKLHREIHAKALAAGFSDQVTGE